MLQVVTEEYSKNFRKVKVYGMVLYIPNWATHIAIDSNAEIWAYNSEPVIDNVSLSCWRQPKLGFGEYQELVGWLKNRNLIEDRKWTHSKKEVVQHENRV